MQGVTEFEQQIEMGGSSYQENEKKNRILDC